jgi:hypothetical protein
MSPLVQVRDVDDVPGGPELVGERPDAVGH